MRKWIEEWRKLNPILADGEVGEIIGLLVTKTGDGTTRWNDLPYTQEIAPDTDPAPLSAIDIPYDNDASSLVATDVQTALDELSTSDGAPAGVPIVRKFSFAFDSPDILTGHPIYTPTVGDILLDAWLEVDTAWDGTSPRFDFGSFLFGTPGLFALANYPIQILDLEIGDASPDPTVLFGGTGNSSLQQVQDTNRIVPAKFISRFGTQVTDPLKIVVSQDGTPTGVDPGSTQGAAVLYLVTATPA